MQMLNRIRGSRARLAAIGVLVVVVGGVACSAATSVFQARTGAFAPAPAAAGAGRVPQPPAPAAQPAAAARSAAAPGAPAAAVSTDAMQSAPASDSAGATGTVPDTTAAQSLNRMVIRTAQLTIEVQNMEHALAQARQIASRSGGIVSTSNTHLERVNDQDRMVADLTLQVRSDTADSAMSDLRALGKVTTEASGSQDVTEEYVDNGASLRNLQASESAILKLMDKAVQIQDVLSLQRELTNVRGQIERIQGRQTYLERRTDMATITLSLRLPPVDGSAQQIIGGAWDPVAVAQRGWQASLTLLRGLAEVVIVAVAFSWWLVPFAALGVYVWVHRRRTTAAPAPTPVES
jgi:Domain of unknown function (DUF4349)